MYVRRSEGIRNGGREREGERSHTGSPSHHSDSVLFILNDLLKFLS